MTEVVGGFLGDLAGIRTIRWSGLGVQAGVDANEQHPDTRHAHDHRNNQHQASSEKTIRRSLRRGPVGFRNSVGVTAAMHLPSACSTYSSRSVVMVRGVWSDGAEVKVGWWGV